MGFLSQVANVFTGSEDAKAIKRGAKARQEALGEAREEVSLAGGRALDLLQPFADVGARGAALSPFLADPQAQAQLAFENPLFQLSRQALTEDISQSAAARGRLTAGDTLEQLQQAGAVAAQPFIDRQRQDILNLLNLGSATAGQQAGIETGTAANIANLISGQGHAQAQGILGAQQARGAGIGNIFDLGVTLAGLPKGTFTGVLPNFGFGSSQTIDPNIANFPPV